MDTGDFGWFRIALIVVACVGTACAERATTPADAAAALVGTSWQLLRFEGGDETILTPDDPAKYSITFGADGRVSVRFDCNRGSGPWKSDAPGHLEFGALGLTRAYCGEGSLHDQLARQWEYLRSYIRRDDHLFLSLMADGGIYELEQIPTSPGGR